MRLREALAVLRANWPVVGRHGSALASRSFALARSELALIAALFVLAGGLWVFLNVVDEVGEGETEALDRALILALRSAGDPGDPLGPRWFEETMRDVTALGGTFVLTFITLAVIGFLLLVGKRGAALLVLFAVGGGTLIGSTMKAFFDRPRPDLVPHGAEVYTASFPSSHAMLSAVTYLTLGALLARLQVSRWTKAYFLGLSVILTAIVGVSRIYLGVHWPTDVLAGWSAGAAWAMGAWVVALVLQRLGKVERMDGD
jgi:undecaprenyl-diphosphatase